MEYIYIVSKQTYKNSLLSVLLIVITLMVMLILMFFINNYYRGEMKNLFMSLCVITIPILLFVIIKFVQTDASEEVTTSIEECFGFSAEDEVDDPRDYCFELAMVWMKNEWTVVVDTRLIRSDTEEKRKELVFDLNNTEAAKVFYNNLKGIIIDTAIGTRAKFYLDRRGRRMYIDYTSIQQDEDVDKKIVANLRTGELSQLKII
jgi:heme/copper-type cytochrome/quinol oxidase subunit 2